MRDGTVVIDGDAGNAVAASIRAGTVVVRGDASTRAGIAMKGGMLIVAGSVGPMAGFMMQKGLLIVCGDAADGVADSMYAGTVFLGGKHGELGADAVFEDVTAEDRELLGAALERWKVAAPAAGFRKLVAGEAALELPVKRTRTCGNRLCDAGMELHRKSGTRGPTELTANLAHVE